MKKILATFIVLCSFYLLSATSVSAKIIASKDGDVTVTKTEIINDDLFIGAKSASIDGTINGDVFVGAETVKITGTINGNLHVGANTIDLNGLVKGNVYAGAQTIFVSGSNISGSFIAGGATINIDDKSSIGGSVITGASTLSLNSKIKRSVYAGVRNLNLGDSLNVGKDLHYATSGNSGTTSISSKAKITGSTYKTEIKSTPVKSQPQKKQFGNVKLFFSIIFFISTLLVSYLYYKFFNKHFSSTVNHVSKSFWKSLGVGFLVMVSFIPTTFIFLLTIVGIPLVGLMFSLVMIYLYLTKIVVGAALGSWLSHKLNWKMSVFGATAFGLLSIFILKFIPVIGFFTGVVVMFVGLGALTLQTFSKSN